MQGVGFRARGLGVWGFCWKCLEGPNGLNSGRMLKGSEALQRKTL